MARTSNDDDKTRASSKERISLDAFVHRKGQVRALEEFKYRKQRKRSETAKALRSYRKVMKQQGYEAGQGASRKRVEETPTAEKATTATASEQDKEGAAKKEYKKRHKMNPFQKAARKAEEHKKVAESKKERKDQGEKERQKRLKERKQRTKLLSKRTKRGQPIMKHMVDNLLSKLEKQDH